MNQGYSLKNIEVNVFRVNLADMIAFDRASFGKNISTSIKKKLKIESKWSLIRLGNCLFENKKSNIKVGTAKNLNKGKYPFFTSGESIFNFNKYKIE